MWSYYGGYIEIIIIVRNLSFNKIELYLHIYYIVHYDIH